MGKTTIAIVLTALITVVLFVLGYFFSFFDEFSFKYEIQVVDVVIGLLTLAITVWLAHWVTNVIETAKDVSKNERDIILSRIADLSHSIDNLIESIYSDETSIIKISASLKQCNLLNDNILFIISNSKSITSDTKFQNQIFLHVKDVKTLMTQYPSSVPLAPGDREPVQVTNNRYIYTEDRKIEIEQILNSIKEQLALYSLFVIQS